MHSKLVCVLIAATALTTTTIAAAPAMAQDAVTSTHAGAAAASTAATQAGAPSLDVAVTYDATMSNLVSTSRFTLQGGGVQIHGRFYGGWGVVADIAGAHASSINSSGTALDLVTATFGPRYTWSPAHRRYALFAQGLAGEAVGFNSIFPSPLSATSTARSLAVKAGGGMDFNLSPRFALRAFEADYLRTQLPNATDNVQNNFRLGAGIVVRIH